jgi:HSP20 family protein
VEIPGVSLDMVTVTVHEGTLRVAGERRPTRELSPESVQRVERYFGPFLREITFPGPVDPKGVKAQLADGLLLLTVPKKRSGKRRIPVR